MRLASRDGNPISLRKVLAAAEFVGAGDLLVDNCGSDPAEVGPGSLFAACDATRDMVREAVRRGCAAVLSDTPVVGVAAPICYVPDSREALGRVCQALAGHPTRHMKVVGVAGSAGKTALSCLVAGVLHSAGASVGVLNSLGCLDGRDVDPYLRGIPESERLAQALAAMAANGCSHVVMAVAGEDIERRRIAGVEFDAACVTCIPDGLAGSARSAREEQWSRRLLGQLTPEGFAVLNADDPGSSSLVAGIDGPALTIGVDLPAEISATIVEQSISEQTFLLVAGGEMMPVTTRMIGRHHVRNCLAAAAVGLAYGFEDRKSVG